MPDPRFFALPLIGGVSAGCVTLVDDIRPTGAPTTDLLWVVFLGALVGWTVQSAPPPLLIVVSGIGAILLRSPADTVHVGLLLSGAVLTATRSQSNDLSRIQLAVIGPILSAAALPWTLLRLADAGIPFLSAGVTLAILTILTLSASRAAPRPNRSWLASSLVGTIALAALLVGLASSDLMAARERADLAKRELSHAMSAARKGDLDLASARLETAAAQLHEAEDKLHSWRITPLRHLPIAGPNVAVSRRLSRDVSLVVDSANELAYSREAIHTLVGPDGLNLTELNAVLVSADAVTDAVSVSSASLEGAQTNWLAPQLKDVVESIRDELAAVAELDLAENGIQHGVDQLLGQRGEQRYLLLFGNPAEARELGGFAGGVAQLTVNQGSIAVERVDRPGSLNERPSSPLAFSEPQPQRFLEHRPWLFAQNYTAMADFPTLARSLGDIYPEMSGSSIDGVAYLDTQAFAALLALSGPVSIDALDYPVTSKNVARLLTVGQYAEFDEQAAVDDRSERIEQRENREGFLAELMEATFTQLLHGQGDVGVEASEIDLLPLMKAIQQDRLLLVPFDPEARRVTDSLGLSGAIAPIGSGDYLAVSHLNGGPNKLDAYLERSITYHVEIDPESGELQGDVTITLTNTTPDDLPLYAAGNSHGYPLGTNRATVVVHTPHELVGWTGGDEPELTRSFREFDRWRHEHVVAVPRGQSRTLTVELKGSVDVDGGYMLDIGHQPLVNADELTIRVPSYINERFTLWHDRTLTSS